MMIKILYRVTGTNNLCLSSFNFYIHQSIIHYIRWAQRGGGGGGGVEAQCSKF